MQGRVEAWLQTPLEVGQKYRLTVVNGTSLAGYIDVIILTKRVHGDFSTSYSCQDAHDPKVWHGYHWAEPHWKYGGCCQRIASAERL